MAKSFAVDERNDLFVGKTGGLAMVASAEAVGVAAKSNAQALLGEMLYAADVGVPFFDVAFQNGASRAQFEAFTRGAIMQTPDVLQIDSFEVFTYGDRLGYSCEILTTFGGTTING